MFLILSSATVTAFLKSFMMGKDMIINLGIIIVTALNQKKDLLPLIGKVQIVIDSNHQLER